MVFQSAEIRWFFKGNIPEKISLWFADLDGIFEKQETRTDQYLLLKNTNSLGIKIREGKFEIKERHTRARKTLTTGNIEGDVEVWTKWSFDSDVGEQSLARSIKGEFIPVEKTRELQKYIFDSKGNISRGFDNYRSNGCNLELTKVILNNQLWWTLGLETYGKPEKQEKNLNTAFYFIFQSEFPGILTTLRSFGYPQWLEVSNLSSH